MQRHLVIFRSYYTDSLQQPCAPASIMMILLRLSQQPFTIPTYSSDPSGWTFATINILQGHEYWSTSTMAEEPPQLEWNGLWRGYKKIKRYMYTAWYCANCYGCNNIIYLDARITGHIFLSLNESRLERFSVSFGFQFAIMSIIEDMVHVCSWKSSITPSCTCYVQKSSQQPPSSERLPIQQQSPTRSSMATPKTTQHQLSSSTDGQQTKIGRQLASHIMHTHTHTLKIMQENTISVHLRHVTWWPVKLAQAP
jgi:hypothetical protein